MLRAPKFDSPALAPGDLTLRQLQFQLPWTLHYNRKFRASEVPHKDFQHALIHTVKALGQLSAEVDRAEHAGADFDPGRVDKYLADLVICALRMANTNPDRKVDLQRVVEDRIEDKNGVKLERGES